MFASSDRNQLIDHNASRLIPSSLVTQGECSCKLFILLIIKLDNKVKVLILSYGISINDASKKLRLCAQMPLHTVARQTPGHFQL